MMDRANLDEGREEVEKERGKMEKGKKMGHDKKTRLEGKTEMTDKK